MPRLRIADRQLLVRVLTVATLVLLPFLFFYPAIFGDVARASDVAVIKGESQAGRDTSEWAYDRSDVVASIKHKRARVAESFDAGTFQGHRYLTWFDIPRAEVRKIELDYLLEAAHWKSPEPRSSISLRRCLHRLICSILIRQSGTRLIPSVLLCSMSA